MTTACWAWGIEKLLAAPTAAAAEALAPAVQRHPQPVWTGWPVRGRRQRGPGRRVRLLWRADGRIVRLQAGPLVAGAAQHRLPSGQIHLPAGRLRRPGPRQEKGRLQSRCAACSQQPGYEEEMREIFELLLASCAQSFERLPCVEDADLLRNILYSGVWLKYNCKTCKAIPPSRRRRFLLIFPGMYGRLNIVSCGMQGRAK